MVARRALVVEDDRSIAELIALYLSNAEIDPESASSVATALERIRQAPFHLVILDLNLPDADGLGFLREFRRTHSTPVIIVSARDSDEDKVAGLMTGADDFLTKPFSPKVLGGRTHWRSCGRWSGAQPPLPAGFSSAHLSST